jgi:hypothetical protein
VQGEDDDVRAAEELIGALAGEPACEA